MATYVQAKNVFIALSSFLNLTEAVHTEPSNPGDPDGYIERVLEIPVLLVAKGDATLRFTLTVWDDSTPDEWSLSCDGEDVVFDNVDRYYGVSMEQHAVIRALLA